AGQLVPPPGGDCRPARARSGNPRAERSRRRDRGAVASLVAHFRRAMAPGTYNPFRAGRSLADARRPGWLAVERARLTLTRQSRLSLAAVVALLLIVFAVRAHNALAMPIFNDESLHIGRAQIVWTFDSPATSFTAGKLLGYYWLGAFGFDRLDALHGGRLVFALAVLLGAAATYRVGRALFGHAVGLLALLFYAIAPYLVFYERMILADQLAAAFGMLAVWAGIRLARRPTRRAGLLSGLFVALAVLAKLTAIPFALVSLAAIWTLGEREPVAPTGSPWRDRLARIVPPRYWPALGAAYAFNFITGLPFILFPIFREVQQEPVLVVGTNLFVTS